MVCLFCNVGHSHFYNGNHLCKYHYWIARGKQKNEIWKGIWKEYRDSHPVRTKRWLLVDPDLKRLLEG